MQIYGSKKGQGKQRQPVIAPDSAQSKAFISIMYGLGEGEIAGLANGYKSVYLEDTPLQNDNGEFNFPNVKVDFRTGTNDQEYIDGFPDVASETAVNVELKHGTPYIKAFNNLDLDALRVRLKWGALRQQNRENGDVSGVKIDYAIDVKTDNGGWVEALNTSINAKTSNAYERSHRIDLPKAEVGWQLRVRRITPNSTSDFVSDKMYVSAITEVIDLKLRYPNTALLGLRYDASSFGSIAKMSARCRGLIIKVPTNYDTVTRTYTGMWDGQFKMAYSNNPAWVYYDLCTAERYGLGGRLTGSMIDKWSLYRLAQYCDEMVDDGMGGQEPRFTVNVYIQSADGAFELLSRLAGVFRAISYWDGTSIVLDADIPQDSIYSFSRANVIDGMFEYTGTRSRDRRTVAKVAWDNPANHFKTEYEYVRDEAAIAKFGVRVADISAWGCTSRGQAQRAGLWALKSEQLETRMVTFKVGLDGLIPAPAKVIEISDELFAGRATGGRVLAVNKTKTVITLDRPITAKAGDTLVINGDDGISQRRQIRSVSGDKITVTKAFGNISTENVWVLDSQDLATMKFRVLSVTADDNHTFTITAVQYNGAKYDAIDHGAYTPERPISVINPAVQAPTKSVNLSSYHTVNQGVSMTTLVIGWEQVAGAVKYQVEWRKDNGNWQALPPTGTNSIEISGVYAGQYEARVTAISAFGQASLATHSNLTQIQGKVGKPPRLARLTATGKLFGMDLAWNFNAGSADTNYTEIQVSPDGRTNITTLGTFAYPTNKHEITGLQGNLTQYYRARIVDKLGNASDWTDWMGGTTSADAAKVLDLISGHITESHLDRALREPIAKIADFDDKFAGFDGRINQFASRFNSKIPTIEQAVQQVNARLPQLNRSIDDLMSDKNAKSQEIVNIKQTLGNTTTQVRDVATSTSNLTRRFGEMAVSQQRNQDALSARMQTVQDSIVSNEQALSRRINQLDAEYKSADRQTSAKIGRVEQSLSDKEQALSERIGRLDSAYKQAGRTAAANLSTLERTLTKADSALSERISQIDTAYKSADRQTSAKIGRLEQSISNKDQAINQMRETIDAKFASLSDNLLVGGDQTKVSTDWGISYPIKEQLSAGQKVKITLKNAQNLTSVAVYNSGASGSAKIGDLRKVGDEWVGEFAWRIYGSNNELILYRQPRRSRQSVQAVLAKYTDTTALIDEVKRTLAEKEQALSERISQLSARMNQPNGKYATAHALDEVKSNVESINDRLTSEASRTSTLQTTLNGQTASIKNVERSVNGVRAIKAVTVDNNGFISGYGLMSDLQNGRVTSRFGINADQIYFGATKTAKKPFIFNTRPAVVDGVSYPAGAWFNTAHIARASINMLHIADSIQSDNYVAGRSGWRLYKSGELEINSSFGDGTKIQLTSRGLTGWYANGQKAFELGVLS
ncbi:TipJ family phage tail tip protein [Moraxella ovis]|uniref:TipJ family phage tail tip protein n=1 Tax=Moraxella ovis TaxID=29433 RepID=UPI000D92F928|nr:phage tail protein [Moraxella ovis]SPX85328.1 chromosome segregation protein SMC [Moraxella ovis]STZ06368.1 chromosome segregation protein SMC [Moraxella ovis]